MSLVIAIKDKDRVVLGADKQVSYGNNKDHSSTKIWEVAGLSGAVMGGVGSARASQIIQYADIVDKNALNSEPTIEFIIRSLAPTICATLDANGVPCDVPTDPETGVRAGCVMMPNAFLFAYKDRAWMIWHDLSVTEIEQYFAIGSGAEVAKGALFATQGQNPFERIVTAIDAASEATIGVDDGIDLLVTEERNTDMKNVAKAFGIEIKKTEQKLDKLEEKKVEIESGDESEITKTDTNLAEEVKEKKAKKTKSKKETITED